MATCKNKGSINISILFSFKGKLFFFFLVIGFQNIVCNRQKFQAQKLP